VLQQALTTELNPNPEQNRQKVFGDAQDRRIILKLIPTGSQEKNLSVVSRGRFLFDMAKAEKQEENQGQLIDF